MGICVELCRNYPIYTLITTMPIHLCICSMQISGMVTSIGITNTDILPQQKAPLSLHYYSNQGCLCHFPDSHFHSYKHPTFM